MTHVEHYNDKQLDAFATLDKYDQVSQNAKWGWKSIDNIKSEESCFYRVDTASRGLTHGSRFIYSHSFISM